MLRTPIAALTAVLLCATPLASVAQAPVVKDTTFAPITDANYRLPLRPTRIVRFTTDEGTWMSVDVSSDGQTIVLDHLGDIYTLPIGGGKATRILGGMAMEVQPRFSPDGRHILYVSDRTGRDQIWVADRDGRNPRQVTRAETGPAASQPIWTPDGQYIVANGNMYHRDGGGGVRIGGTGQFAPTGGGYSFTPDGRQMYYSVSRGAVANVARFQVAMLDRRTGQVSVRTGNTGGAFKPVISPDGKYLLYATRYDAKTALKLRDLVTGDEIWLATDFQHDASERSASLGHLPNAAFTPDSRALIASTGGKLWRIAVPTGTMTPIPFSVDVEQHLGPLTQFEYTIPDSFTVRQIRDAVPSPDGRRLAFTALDRLYIMDLSCGPGASCPARRITQGTDVEVSPAWSPDGRHLAWATWNDFEGGHLYRVPAAGGSPERLTRVPAAFSRLAYTPESDRLVFVTTSRRARMGITDELLVTVDGGVDLAWIPASGGEPRVITSLADQGDLRVALSTVPHFVASDSGRVLFGSGGATYSIRLDGLDRRTVVRTTGTTVVSPAGDRAVNATNRVIYLFTVPQTGSDSLTINVSGGAGAQVPSRRVSLTGGEFVGWTADGRAFYYSIGRSFFRYDVARGDAAVRDSVTQAETRRAAGDTTRRDTAADSTRRGAPAYQPDRIDVDIRLAREAPRGAVVLRGGRIITMRGSEVIPSGDVVVVDNKIVAVGPRGRVAVPANARVIDVSGKTIIPGYVDIHAHVWAPWLVHKQQVPGYYANLAFGVTTMRDPQTSESDIITYSDREAVGDLLAPRMLSTGPGVFSSDNIRSLDDARDILRRYADHFQTQTLKQYLAGDRRTRQFVIMAARELGITPTTEGAGDFKMSISEFLDGYSGHEHAYEIFPIYADVAHLAAASGITYTPTLGVAYGGPENKNYWFSVDKPHDNAKLRRFFYHPELDARTLRRSIWASEEQYIFRGVAAGANRILQAGGRTGLGSHGELQGLAAHWELWMFQLGGMSNHDVLRTGTIFGADAIGMGKLLGSIEAGKLADLQVLDANPLVNIRNTTAIRYVMKNGRLYDAETLDEVWPVARKAAPFWWTSYDPAPHQE